MVKRQAKSQKHPAGNGWRVAYAATFALVPSVPSLGHLAAAEAPADQPVADQSTAVELTDEEQALFAEMAAQLDLQEQKAIGQDHFLKARSFYTKAEYEKAREAIETAILACPGNADFQALREDILTALGDRPSQIQSNLDHIEATIAVEIESAVIEVRNEIERGDKAMNAEAYQDVITTAPGLASKPSMNTTTFLQPCKVRNCIQDLLTKKLLSVTGWLKIAPVK